LNTEPSAVTNDPTDGKNQYEWRSRYPVEARKEQMREGIFLFALLFISLIIVFINWKGYLSNSLRLSPHEAIIFKKYTYYVAGGMLGGIIFDMKYFYRAVARGWWHQDRKPWRILSPFIAMVIALIIGAMIDGCIMKAPAAINGAAVISIAFIAGYFADEAVGKMYEIASVIFGNRVIASKETGGTRDGKEESR